MSKGFRRGLVQTLQAVGLAVVTFAAGLAMSTQAQAQTDKDRSVFVFGNSLVHHLTDSDQTTMPYWLARLADAGNHGLALDGTWGFMRDFARNLPPTPNWSFDGVDRAWRNDSQAFRMIGFDTVVITPANFIQYQPADRPYDGDNPSGASPFDAALRIIEWTAEQAPGARIFIYEGWSDMAPITRFPPNARGLRRYHAHNQGEYTDWYADFAAMLQDARPDLSINRIPVASILARVLTETALSDLDGEVFYSDDAPHGTADLYFLTALISYAALYGEAPPAVMDLPDTLSPVLRDIYPEIAALVWSAYSGAVLPDDQARVVVPETGLTNPSLAMGLNGIADWSTQQPFIDLVKSARPWVGHLPGQWGGWGMERLETEGYLDPQGWPRALPPGVTALESFVLTAQDPANTSLTGRYLVRWEGSGRLLIGGLARDIDRPGDNELTFSFRPGDGSVSIRIEETDPADPIRNIVMLNVEHLPMYEVGAVFNPAWIARIRDLRSVRFMDWMDTNGSEQQTWEDRPRIGDFTYFRRGVPVEVMVQLANEIGADPWFTLPHMADDAYVQAFATYVHENLDPRLRTYAEWSNEVWNFLFPQATWARLQAEDRWAEQAQDGGWMQFAGLRAAQVADIWTEVYGEDAPDRLVRVIATHTGWLGLEETLLMAPLVQAEGLPAPVTSFDAYAVTGYFGYDLGEDAFAAQLLGWIEDGTATQRSVEALREGSLAELTGQLWPHHARVAAENGLTLLMYEGGTHIVGTGAVTEDDRLTAFYTGLNYSPEIAAIYAELITEWTAQGGEMFNAFVDVSVASRWGSWGSLRHLDDVNARWETLAAFNAVPHGGLRAEGAFEHGVLRVGGAAADRLEGTVEEDILLGGSGDDTLVSFGGADRLNGGAGSDLAVLPGRAEDYAMAFPGTGLLLIGPTGTLHLNDIEAIEFAATPGVILPLTIPELVQ